MNHLTTIIEDATTGEQICACCGMILDEKPNIRGISRIENHENIHWKNTIQHHHDYALGSIADTNDKNSRNINLWQNRLRASNSLERRIYSNFIELENIFAKKQVPNTIKKITHYLSRKASKSGIDIGSRKEMFQAVLLYFAFELSQNKYPRRQFIRDYTLKTKTFNKYVWLIKEEFKIISNYEDISNKLLYRHATNLKFPKKTTTLANAIIEHARKKYLLSGKDIGGIVATALYIAYYSTSKRKPKINEIIAKECGTSIASMNYIRRQWSEILEILNLRKQVVNNCKFI